ncbi:MAG: prephenate dehydrogenase/arogenate dehydrogenase family protein [Clostridia bacterium]|nr:prephenate dehydrogenase/arogenate dehydrogenase family protein [Clostridia bacterium]
MKKIAIIGLGIIGGSLAGALTNAGYRVDGTDLNEKSVQIAMEKGYIQAEATAKDNYDAVFIAIPPKATAALLETGTFKDGAFVADICGVKKLPERAVYAKKRNYRYIGLHPMAGKETSGILSATPTLFQNANLVITIAPETDENTLKEARKFAKEIGFGKIVECSADEHDQKIALTSQLAHIVSNAYVKSGQVRGCDGFTGGSFQDMTRIAGVDERVWTDLYFSNKENLLNELNGLISHLQEYVTALNADDEKALAELLKAGRVIREGIKRGND